MLNENRQMLKHHLFAVLSAFPPVSACIKAMILALALAACCKDDPEPGPEPPVPPVPPTPEIPEAQVPVPLRLHARPEGDETVLWQDDDTLHVILTEENGLRACGDTAFYRYTFAPADGMPQHFAPATPADTAFMPADSSRLDLLVYRPANAALRRDSLWIPVDASVLTASGRPFMTAQRTDGLHLLAPEATVTLQHRLTRLSLNLVPTGTAERSTKAQPDTPVKATLATDSLPFAGARVMLKGNPSEAVWSLTQEAFIAYGDTASQYFTMSADGTDGYLYAIPGYMPGAAGNPGEGDTKPQFSLLVDIPGREPIIIPLDDYLPDGTLEVGISIDIRINIPVTPDNPDNPDHPDNPDNPDNPNVPDYPNIPDYPNPPTPPDPDIIRISVTLTDWENIIYDCLLYPDI